MPTALQAGCLPNLTRHSLPNLNPRCCLPTTVSPPPPHSRNPASETSVSSHACCPCEACGHGVGRTLLLLVSFNGSNTGVMTCQHPRRAWVRPASTCVTGTSFQCSGEDSAWSSVPWTLPCSMSWHHCTTSCPDVQAAPSSMSVSQLSACCAHETTSTLASAHCSVSLRSKPQGNRGVCPWAPAPAVRVPGAPVSSAPGCLTSMPLWRLRTFSSGLKRPLQSLPLTAIVSSIAPLNLLKSSIQVVRSLKAS